MTNSRWQEKILAYREFRDSGQSQKHYGTRNFRVMTITTGERRLANLKKASEKAGGGQFFWFTTQDKLNIWQPSAILEAIWSVASDEVKQALF